MNIKILVATHKKYWMPEDKVYVPLHVGAENKTPLIISLRKSELLWGRQVFINIVMNIFAS